MGVLHARVGGVWVPIVSQGATGPGVAAGGATGQVLAKTSATDYDTGWINRPGEELLYSQIVANVTTTATTDAAAVGVINPGNITYDGTTVILEFFAAAVEPPNVTNGQIILSLWDTNTDLGYWGQVMMTTASTMRTPVLLRRRLTPTAGAHNYNVRARIGPSGTGTVYATSTPYPPAFLRVTRL